MRKMTQTTLDAIAAYFKRSGNGSQLSRCAGLSVSDFYNAWNRQRATLSVENAIRRCLDLPPIQRKRYARPCVPPEDVERAAAIGYTPGEIWQKGMDAAVNEASLLRLAEHMDWTAIARNAEERHYREQVGAQLMEELDDDEDYHRPMLETPFGLYPLFDEDEDEDEPVGVQVYPYQHDDEDE